MQNEGHKTAFTVEERRLIARLNTPEKIQAYLNHALPYNWEKGGETIRSFRSVVREKSAHCLEAVFFTATILAEYGYPPLVLDLSSIDNMDHCLFLYKRQDRYGTIGISREPELHGKPATFPSIHKLVMSYYDDYISDTACLDGYAVVDLDTIPRANWRFSERNLWQVENYLIEFPHHKISISPRRWKKLRREYLKSIQQQPHSSTHP